MKIAVLGAGAMGSIYGGHLSMNNDVYMIDKKEDLVEKISADGLKLYENDKDVVYYRKCVYQNHIHQDRPLLSQAYYSCLLQAYLY